MCRFIETICYQSGTYRLLHLHQERIAHTFRHFFPESRPFLLDQILPPFEQPGKYKFRIIYDKVVHSVNYVPYGVRDIRTLELVHSNMTYGYKFENRNEINHLLDISNADDIIIIKNGMVTDSSYSNLAFWDGNQWLTPDTPLLHGVKRRALISMGILKSVPVRARDLGKFEKVSLINAMLDLGDIEINAKALFDPQQLSRS